MQKSTDGERFTVLIQAMAATFRADVTPALLEGYWMGLEDIPIEHIERAVRRGIRECEFMPAAYKLRELMGGGPDYYRPVEPQLEAIETCPFHSLVDYGVELVANPEGHVPWCRKCKRWARLPANRGGEPMHVADIMERLLLAPPEGKPS